MLRELKNLCCDGEFRCFVSALGVPTREDLGKWRVVETNSDPGGAVGRGSYLSRRA